MKRLNLFLDLMGIIHDLLEVGVTSSHVNDARMQMDFVFDDFEENEGVDEQEIHQAFEDTFFKIEHMPEELKQYFHTVEIYLEKHSKNPSKNEIYLKALPPQFWVHTPEQIQLMVGLFNILNELLRVGICGCNNHQARIQIDDLCKKFEEQEDVREAEHLRKILNDEFEDSINHLFPEVKQKLESF